MAQSREGGNQLRSETSPYLLQHAENPVDWYPWGEEAFERAAAEEKPIFLSIGYSACHWCHVMEHESFEDAEIASYLNEHFVSVKVDREERPDVDAIYMNAVVAMTGRGGWPMSVFLTPTKRPFFGGTYWPAQSQRGMPGFIDILKHVEHAWRERRGEVDRAAGDLVRAIEAMGEPVGEPQTLGEEVLRNVMRQLIAAADRTNGGFGRAPKFPHAVDLRVLLRGARRSGSSEALAIVAETLEKMCRGGLYDQLGGGFHRYSTDEVWLVPHFEKMLYDQALLVPAYLEAYQATRCEEFADVARGTLNYVIREMTSPEGGFYSTQDADSEGMEGKFFVWSRSEIESLLEPEEAELFCRCYGVTVEGNWEGTNILHRAMSSVDAAKATGIEANEFERQMQNAREILFAARGERIAPARDEKILVAWNGLMIVAFAQGGSVLDEPVFVDVARSAANYLLEALRTPDGRLLHTAKEGAAKLNAYLDDYGALILGLVELFEATGETQWFESALALATEMVELFSDANGGFYYTSRDHEELIVRQRDSQDGATPSGNSLAATALLKVARLADRRDLEDLALATLDRMSGQIAKHPLASGQALLALEFLLGPAKEVVLVGDEAGIARLRRAIEADFVPNKFVIPWRGSTREGDVPPALASLLAGKGKGGEALAYICERGMCGTPLSDPAAVRKSLAVSSSEDELRRLGVTAPRE